MTTGKKGIFLDTFFIQALLNRRDQYHGKAKSLFHRSFSPEVWTMEAVLIEVGALASINREGATEFIKGCYNTPNLEVVPLDTPLIDRHWALMPPGLTRSGGSPIAFLSW